MMAKLYAQGGGEFSVERARQSTERLLAEPEFGGVWIIEMDGAAAGYVVFVMGYSLEFGGRFGLLDELYLEEDWRGKGLGKHAIEFAAVAAIGVVCVLTLGRNQPRTVPVHA